MGQDQPVPGPQCGAQLLIEVEADTPPESPLTMVPADLELGRRLAQEGV